MDLIVEHCPRCLARSGRVSELHLSDMPRPFSGMPVAEPPEPELGDSPDAALEEPAEAEIELPSVPQLG
jgi:hypothetical protein